jgi:hypothetical protein
MNVGDYIMYYHLGSRPEVALAFPKEALALMTLLVLVLALVQAVLEGDWRLCRHQHLQLGPLQFKRHNLFCSHLNTLTAGARVDHYLMIDLTL